MIQRIKDRRKRQQEIKSLEDHIAKEFEEATKDAKTAKEREEAEQAAYSWTLDELNELTFLQQEELLIKLRKSPLDVPIELWESNEYVPRKTLTRKGEIWVRHELKKLRNAEVEFWAKLVLPVVALIISIIALLRNH